MKGIDNKKKREYYYSLADELANYLSFRVSDPKVKELEMKLLKGGNEALYAIRDYLLAISSSTVVKRNIYKLVELIKSFPGDREIVLKSLISQPTNIWEYYRDVKKVAQKELIKLQQPKEEVKSEDETEISKNNQLIPCLSGEPNFKKKKMSITCKLFGHNWDLCRGKCKRCGKNWDKEVIIRLLNLQDKTIIAVENQKVVEEIADIIRRYGLSLEEVAIKHLANKASSWIIREAAVGLLCDEILLEEIAKTDWDTAVQKAALTQLHKIQEYERSIRSIYYSNPCPKCGKKKLRGGQSVDRVAAPNTGLCTWIKCDNCGYLEKTEISVPRDD